MPRNTSLSGVVKKSEQIISMVMGVLVVVIIGVLAYRFFQGKGESILDDGISESFSEQISDESITGGAGIKKHIVVLGDNLWKIAEGYYRSGYNWVDIAKENNIGNPNLIAVGQELVIPDVESKETTIGQLPATGVDITIEGENYTVSEGDSLSKISMAAYGDLYQWTKIWSANKDKFPNPDLIFPGIEIKIPR